MSTELNLEISQYSIEDLEVFFQLDKPFRKDVYAVTEIDAKMTEIRTLLLSTGHIAKHLKRDLIAFLQQGRDILVKHKTIKPKPHTSLPQNNQTSEDVPPAHYPAAPNAIATTTTTTTVNTTQYNPNDVFLQGKPLGGGGVAAPVSVSTGPPATTRIGELIDPKQSSFTYTQPSEFFPGLLNPLDTRTIRKCISVDTRFRKNPFNTNNTDYTLQLPNRLSKVISLELSSFEISPGTIPNISSNMQNNYVSVQIITSSSPANPYSQLFTVPNGYYTESTLIAKLNALLASTPTDTPYRFVEFVRDEATGLIQFRKKTTASGLQSIGLDFAIRGETGSVQNDYFARIGRLLGFTKSSETYTGSLSYTADSLANVFADIPYIYVSVQDYQNRSSYVFEPICTEIPMSEAILARCSFQYSETTSIQSRVEPMNIQSVPRKYFGPVDIQRFHIQLLDSYGKVLQIPKHRDYSFCLTVNTIYDM